MKFAIVLLSSHGVAEANACLEAIAATTPAPHTRDVCVVLTGAVVDDFDAEGGLDLHDPASEGSVELDPAAAVTAAERAIQSRKADVVLVLSDDVRMQEGWFEALQDTYRHRRDAAVLAPYVVHRDGARERITLSEALDDAAGVCTVFVLKAVLAGRSEPFVQVPRARGVISAPPAPSALTRRDLGPALHQAFVQQRRVMFNVLHDMTQGRGLEVGPADTPLADPALHDVDFVDVYDRAGMLEKYADDGGVILEMIPEITYPMWDGTAFRPVHEAAAAGAPYDWVLASHVIEHVADVITWLQGLADLTVDGGALVLAVPDRRFTFDRHRPPTTTGMMLQAYLDKHTAPSARAVYDHASSGTDVDAGAMWQGLRPPARDLTGLVQPALTAATKAHAGEYTDVHVWMFTPQSFLEQIKELRELGLCPWWVETLRETKPGDLEFRAVLRRVPRGSEEIFFNEPEAASDLPEWVEAEWRLRQAMIG